MFGNKKRNQNIGCSQIFADIFNIAIRHESVTVEQEYYLHVESKLALA